jgi:hypothetical protein
MKKILNFLSISGVIVLCLKYFLDNKISLGVAFFILLVTVIIASRDGLVWQFIKAGLALFSIGILIKGYAFNSIDYMSILQPILISLIGLFAIFIILSGLFKSDSANDEVHYIFDKKTGKLKRKNNWW